MKSLHIIGSKAMGGAERWFCRFTEALHRNGDEVEALVRRGSELETHHLRNLPHSALPMRTVWDPLSRFEVTRYARQSKAPIVQTYMGRATRLTHLRPGRGQVHLARLGGYYKLDGYRHAHGWIGNTKGLCDWLVAEGMPARHVHHIYNFISPPPSVEEQQVAALREDLGLEKDDWALVTPGRFVPVKGQRYLIDALARLPLEIAGRRLRLLMVGDGPLEDTLRQQAADLGVSDRVVWCGWQQDPAPFLTLADAIVFPSRDRETFGNVILEAWSYGRPLVTTAFRGAREIARHGEDSYVVPCEDPPALARGIEAVLQDPQLQASFVTAGHERIRRDFSEAAIIAQYRELYDLLLSSA